MTTTQPPLKVRKDRAYGNVLFYPVCEKSRLFAKLADRKTLTLDAIQTIKKLGYTFQLQQEAI